MVHINEFLSVYNGYELLYGKNTRNCCPKLIFFVMEQVIVDQILSRTLFEKESSGKSTQKFCNQITLPRSEVVFFLQMSVILMLLVLCIVKLTVLKPTCEEATVWI